MSKSFYAKMHNMDDSGHMDPVERILRKDKEARTPEDLSILEGKVENNEFLLKFKNTPKIRDLCRTMKIGSYQADEVIITEGEVGDKFYILYIGEVSISKGQKQQILKGKIVQVSSQSVSVSFLTSVYRNNYVTCSLAIHLAKWL